MNSAAFTSYGIFANHPNNDIWSYYSTLPFFGWLTPVASWAAVISLLYDSSLASYIFM